MATDPKRIRRLLFRTLPILSVFILLLAALYLVNDVKQGSEQFAQLYYWVLGLAGLALLLLLVSISLRLIQLIRQVREEAPGARLSARMVRIFLILAVPPAVIVYLFSVQFLNDTIEGWFDVQIESALQDSIELGRRFLDERTLQVRNQMLRLAEDVGDLNQTEIVRQLSRRVSASGPVELDVFSSAGRILATANINPLAAPDSPDDFALLQAVERGEYAAAEPISQGVMQVRVLIEMPASGAGSSSRYLQAIYPLSESFTGLASNIQEEYNRYQRVSYLRNPLKQSFILILSLVLLITVLIAILAAINAARRMVKPISELAAATEAVAKGDFSREIQESGKDELSFLLRSFNLMTQSLKQARGETERQREYLEAVLGRLSAGVLAFDADQCLTTCNDSSRNILGVALDTCIGDSVSAIMQRHPLLTPLLLRLQTQLQTEAGSWREEIKLERDGNPLVLMCRGSSLPPVSGNPSGHVLVFDDVTILDQAQREAAWSEVARRLAHEVKNPLTPIRLSAERLRLKLADTLPQDQAALLQRSTQTIMNQVDALKSLVNAFGDYAQEPRLQRRQLGLDELVREVVEMYRDPNQAVQLELSLVSGEQRLHADPGRLRQLLHNLMQNAVAAVRDCTDGRIQVNTGVVSEQGQDWLQLQIRDNGSGLHQDVAGRHFEPYLTTKSGGTGLGLAICRKIAEEHGGRIKVENAPDRGVNARVWFPAVSAEG